VNPILAAAPLLQTRYEFLATPDRRSTIIFLLAAAGFIGLITIGGVIARQRHRGVQGKECAENQLRTEEYFLPGEKG